ncbi:40S ribosomal protein S4-3 [Zea mays]|uniref:40S ribosomal protein S4-3 n=1 Tax=Zea mays TaxID=4577 RepID=A0A1D6EP41_MAIZE|nr:40S ribosomal protein S4-3 [Zea mays]
MPLLLHQPLLLLNASADHHLPWRRSSPISSCQGAVAELALPQPWMSLGHPSPISPRPHPLAAAPSYSWWLSLLPWMLVVLPSLVLTSAPCVGWPVAPALGLSSANSAPSIPARILLIGPAQIILMPGRGTTATAMKPHCVAPSTCSTEYRSTCRPDLQPWLRGRQTPLPSTLCLTLHQCDEMSERIDDMRPEFDSARLFDVYFTHCDLVDDVFVCASTHCLKLHIDGARIFHASAALGVLVDRLVKAADSVLVCLSKGLGAPVGSVIVGSKASIDKARILRKTLGGGMRHVGVLCAAAHVAVRDTVGKLADDHKKAKALAVWVLKLLCLVGFIFLEGLKKIEQITVDSASVETNMFKLYKVRSVLFGQKGIPYLNTYDGRTMRYPDPLIKANDTIKIDLETNKIMDFIKLYLPFHGLHQVIYLVRLNVSTNSSASDPSGHAVLRPTLSFVGVRYPLLSGPAASNPSPEVAFMPLRSEIPANAAPAQTPAPEPVGRLMDSVHKVFYAVVEAAAVRADNSHLGDGPIHLYQHVLNAGDDMIGVECLEEDCDGKFAQKTTILENDYYCECARYLIPILYVSVELVKALQAHIINWDIHMFDEEIGNTTQAGHQSMEPKDHHTIHPEFPTKAFKAHKVYYLNEGGKFDHADRLFQSIESAYINRLSNTSDVKELIPEFFYMPEFLENSNSYHLGVKQDGELIGDVALPPWAKDSSVAFLMTVNLALQLCLALQRTTSAYSYVAQLHNLKDNNSSDEFDKDSIESGDRSLEELSWETLELLVVPHIFR